MQSDRAYIRLKPNIIALELVENHLKIKAILDICLFTLVTICIAAELLENHLLRKSILQDICLFTLKTNLNAVERVKHNLVNAQNTNLTRYTLFHAGD